MGFGVEGEDLQNVRVVKCNSEAWETVKVNWTVTQTGSLLKLDSMVPRRLSLNLMRRVSLRAIRIELFNPSLINGFTPTWTSPMWRNL